MLELGEERLKVLHAPNELSHKEFINKFDENGRDVLNYLIKLPYDRQYFQIHVLYTWTENQHHLDSVHISPYLPGDINPTF